MVGRHMYTIPCGNYRCQINGDGLPHEPDYPCDSVRNQILDGPLNDIFSSMVVIVVDVPTRSRIHPHCFFFTQCGAARHQKECRVVFETHMFLRGTAAIVSFFQSLVEDIIPFFGRTDSLAQSCTCRKNGPVWASSLVTSPVTGMDNLKLMDGIFVDLR